MIQVTEKFALKYNGTKNGMNIFNAVMCNNTQSINYSKWVCSEQAVNDFPELFDGITVKSIIVNQSDFINQDIIHN
jgi:hypothetical protein